jgi:hypothetical protein
MTLKKPSPSAHDMDIFFYRSKEVYVATEEIKEYTYEESYDIQKD